MNCMQCAFLWLLQFKAVPASLVYQARPFFPDNLYLLPTCETGSSKGQFIDWNHTSVCFAQNKVHQARSDVFMFATKL